MLSQHSARLPYHGSLFLVVTLTALFLLSALSDVSPAMMLVLAVSQPLILLLFAHQLRLFPLPFSAVKLAWQRFRV
ncbi:hypothetical protein VII00023_13087 [Vibrio ichthyoenteri ATCC 700023]|uniref:Uncharacterized protein n=1 Tax=Vibrio ichthyoenteri ATCC 700023 TaxID=870968 RepID=F9RZP9_9VIBR|nr:hypothetical protein [Vibrio ichthyoenteri]EGU44457.1 hypothetical protein VII00023_13087 [Vibrio ichthyoenteri ATCC 700023]